MQPRDALMMMPYCQADADENTQSAHAKLTYIFQALNIYVCIVITKKDKYDERIS